MPFVSYHILLEYMLNLEEKNLFVSICLCYQVYIDQCQQSCMLTYYIYRPYVNGYKLQGLARPWLCIREVL